MGRGRGLWWLAVIWIAAGCSVSTSGIRPDAPVDASRAYLYGRFTMKADLHYGVVGKQAMALVVHCKDRNGFRFGTRGKGVQVLEVAPSRCWLLEAVFADQDGMVRGRLEAKPPLQRVLHFEAGHAYYLGDYFAAGDFKVGRGYRVWRYAMSPADDRYESTTAEMKRTFPNLASWPTSDSRLIPALEPGDEADVADDEAKPEP
jgi:hypothetical protein